MSSKAQTDKGGKVGIHLKSAKSAPEGSAGLAKQSTHPTTIIRRARLDRKLLTAANVLDLQRMIGNRAAGKVLSGGRSCPVIQAKLAVGAANDHPGNQAGQELPAYEFTHVVQQRQGLKTRGVRSQSASARTTIQGLVNHATVQRRIILVPAEGQEAEQTLADLQKIIGNDLANLLSKTPTGELAMASTTPPQVVTAGFRLLERMIRSGKLVQLASPTQPTKPTNRPESLEDARNPSTGTGSTVSVPIALTMRDLVKTAQDELVREDTKRHIVLAHELIHADRAQRGRKAKGGGEINVTGNWENPNTGLLEKINKKNVFAMKEELETVGLIMNSADPDQITENMIRAELGEKLRVTYDETALGLPGLK
jgi:hypothetical protein